MSHRLRGDVEGTRALLDELDRLEDLQGYTGLVSANRAWIALREADHEATRRFAAVAFEDWTRGRRSGPTVFQWTARFPLLGVELAAGDVDAALEQARHMLDPLQQPLAEGLRELLSEAVEKADAAVLKAALELARTTGRA